MAEPLHLPERPGRSRVGCALGILLIVIVLAALAAWIFHRIETWPSRAARDVRNAFAQVANLQPKITVKNRVFFEQTTSVLELAVLSRETQVEREAEHEWLGSKKRIKLRGVYHVKAGFDLTQPFTVNVEDKRVVAQLPPPRILSVEQVDVEVLAFENGIWNRIRPADLEHEMRALPVLARQKESEAGLQREALEIFTKRLQDKFAPEYQVEVKIAQPSSPAL